MKSLGMRVTYKRSSMYTTYKRPNVYNCFLDGKLIAKIIRLERRVVTFNNEGIAEDRDGGERTKLLDVEVNSHFGIKIESIDGAWIVNCGAKININDWSAVIRQKSDAGLDLLWIFVRRHDQYR